MITRLWKIYGANGHRQRESFNPSAKYDWSTPDKIRVVEIINADKTGTNDYSVLKITRDNFEDCESEFFGQISDGIFENCRVGEIEEMED